MTELPPFPTPTTQRGPAAPLSLPYGPLPECVGLVPNPCAPRRRPVKVSGMFSSLLTTSGGLGLFLLGMSVMTTALKSLGGRALRTALARFTKSPGSGALTGAVVTALIQSSSATTVTAVGFVGAGLLTFTQVLGVIFGANLGTTATGWLVALLGFKLNLGELVLPLILLGALAHLFLRGRAATVGFALAGFGLIIVGIGYMQQGMQGLEGAITPNDFPDDTWVGRFLLVLIGIGLTVVTQSSSAGVATALAAVNTGTINFPQAAAMVIGMDVGTTVTALLATVGGSTDARRTGFAHLFYNLLTAVCAYLLLTPYTWLADTIAPGSLEHQPEIALVAFHSLYNALVMFTVLPFTASFARLIVAVVPAEPIPFTGRLDHSLYDSPAIALGAVRGTLEELARVVFRELALALAGQGRPPTTPSLEEVNEALKRTRDFLEPISTSSEQLDLFPQQVAAIHTIDHLRRLIDRCQEQDRVARIRGEAELASLGANLKQAVDVALDAIPRREVDLPVDRVSQAWQQLDEQAEQRRRLLVESAAAGQIDAYAAIGQLDSLRWLRRVALSRLADYAPPARYGRRSSGRRLVRWSRTGSRTARRSLKLATGRN